MEEKKKSNKLKIIISIVVASIIIIAILVIVGIIIMSKVRTYYENNPITINRFDYMKKDDFYSRLTTIILQNNKNDLLNNDLLGLSCDKETGVVSYEKKPIGVYTIQEKDNKIASIIISVHEKAVGYREMMVATFLVMDEKLTYEEAEEISKTLENDALFGR